MDPSIPARERDPLLPVGEACPIDHANKTLVDQAEGLGRATIMSNVVGPTLTELLKPIYAERLNQGELQSLQSISSCEDLSSFCADIERIATDRADSLEIFDADKYFELVDLGHARKDFAFGGWSVKEGVTSGILVPFTIATQIYAAESSEDDLTHFFDRPNPITAEDLIRIMERPVFDEILFKLTKGPNGFLGPSSTSLYLDDHFFSFMDDLNETLSIREAYEIEDDTVTGLSNKYYITANKRRENHRKYQNPYMGSSGCPVRHSFPDPETGENHEPLVITAKNFLMAALRASQEQPKQEAA